MIVPCCHSIAACTAVASVAKTQIRNWCTAPKADSQWQDWLGPGRLGSSLASQTASRSGPCRRNPLLGNHPNPAAGQYRRRRRRLRARLSPIRLYFEERMQLPSGEQSCTTSYARGAYPEAPASKCWGWTLEPCRASILASLPVPGSPPNAALEKGSSAGILSSCLGQRRRSSCKQGTRELSI